MEELHKIVDGCKAGKEKYQSLLYQLYSKKMFGVCMFYSKNQTEAEDLLQEGFIKVFASIKQLKDNNLVEAWMRRVFVTTFLQQYRKKNILQYEVDMPEPEPDFSHNDILDAISARELMELIQTLTPQYRMVFNLYAVEGYSHQEIGEMLRISEGTSKSNLSRARTILQEQISEKFGTERKIRSIQ